MENLIEVEDLHFSFNTHPVLKGVNLAIPRGKVVGIMGASGSGKSTLLRHFTGKLHPAQGQVKFMGHVMHKLGTEELYRLRLQMGMMFQVSGLFTDLTVFENLAFPLREHTDLPEDIIRDLVLMKLYSVGLENTADMRPAELSGGMERRVALARATITDPALIIYDEPFAGLDPISLSTIANLIRKLNDALGVTSIVITYDLSESLKIVDYVYFLHNGVVVAQGDVAEMRDSNNAFVGQFLHGKEDGPIAFQADADVPYGKALGVKP